MRKKTGSIFAILLGLLFCFSCKKDKKTTVNSDQFTLAAPVLTGDSLKLNWSKLDNDSLVSYILVASYDTTSPNATISHALDKSVITYVDTLALSSYVQYYVVAQLSSGVTVVSNKTTYVRTDMVFMGLTPRDVIYDRASNIMCLYGSYPVFDKDTASSISDIFMYDVQNKKVISQLTVNVLIGYCDMGIYNGVKELYVPRADGWLYIYNAATLQQIDQINVGEQLSCVVYNNGILFVTGLVNSFYVMSSYSRSTKALVSLCSPVATNGSERLKLIPNTNSYLFAANGLGGVSFCHFDNSGTFSAAQSFSKYTGVTFNVYPFEVFPDGSKFIAGSSGVIVSDSLDYLATIPGGTAQFRSFDFDTTNQIIYAGCVTRAIQAYTMSNYELTKTLTPQGFPSKVFYNNGSIISVSQGYFHNNSIGDVETNFVFVEQL